MSENQHFESFLFLAFFFMDGNGGGGVDCEKLNNYPGDAAVNYIFLIYSFIFILEGVGKQLVENYPISTKYYSNSGDLTSRSKKQTTAQSFAISIIRPAGYRTENEKSGRNLNMKHIK